MTDKTFTDEEIVKALECCFAISSCDGCPLQVPFEPGCVGVVGAQAFSLINRQKAEIERLTVNMNAFALGMKAEKERADGIVDAFAERMKEKMKDLSRMEYDCVPYFLVSKSFIDKTAEELKQ